MAKPLSFGVRAGARAFQQLLRDVHAKTEADLDVFYKVHPDRGPEDARDYPGVCRLVRASIDSSLSHGDAAQDSMGARRQGQ